MDNSQKPAFPMQGHNYDAPDEGWYHIEHQHGLTKREKFAMAAMQGILSQPADKCITNQENHNHVAANAIRYADTLLEKMED